jgi:hypothetical protein
MIDQESQHDRSVQSDRRCIDSGPLTARAFRIADVCVATGFGRTTVYAAIKAGDLIAQKYRRSTVVLADDLTKFLANLPKVRKRTGG